MIYSYDLAGDVTRYSGPDWFTVNYGINSDQQQTSMTWGGNAAVSSISYTPWGAISTICGGASCSDSQETIKYNDRLQPVLMELGNSGSAAADYCEVYNYCQGSALPASCAVPTPGSSGNDGSVAGVWYKDNVNTGYSHTTSYSYDSLGRFSGATAKDFSSNTLWTRTYSYDRYGNPTCGPGSLNTCNVFTPDSSTNRIISFGSSGSQTDLTYDADGDLASDGTHNFQYDAERRMVYASWGSTWESSIYNALGERMTATMPDGTGNNRTLIYPWDIFGHRTEMFEHHPSAGWTGADVWWGRVAGQRLEMGGGNSWLAHVNVVGSLGMETNQTGTVTWDAARYPWGRFWKTAGSRASGLLFAGMQWQGNDPLQPSATREYSPGIGRWMAQRLARTVSFRARRGISP